MRRVILLIDMFEFKWIFILIGGAVKIENDIQHLGEDIALSVEKSSNNSWVRIRRYSDHYQCTKFGFIVIIAGDQVLAFSDDTQFNVQTNDVATLQSLGFRKSFIDKQHKGRLRKQTLY